MKSMKKDFRMVASGLKTLARKTEQMAKKVDKLEKANTVKKPTTKAKANTTNKAQLKKKATNKAPAKKKAVVRKSKTTTFTATGRILKIVETSKKGVDVPELAKKTQYNDKKIRDILSRAFAQGKVRRVGRGIYRAA